jgi:toxin secretion/phage lysis holin
MLDKINPSEIFKFCSAGTGACISYFFGGWSQLLQVLLAFVIVDYITGVLASALEGKLSSAVGSKGIAKKVFIFVIVAIAHLVDVCLGDGNMFRDAAIFFYLANELLSIIENSGRVGLPVPDILQKAIEMFKAKSNEKGQ